jgi:hypothetical protein
MTDNEEIEITPEMIEAGAEVLDAVDMRVWDSADIAEAVFTAMWSARRRRLP